MARTTGTGRRNRGPPRPLTDSSSTSSSKVPEKFEHVPPDFARLFLATLPQESVYLVHIDTWDRIHKRRVFLAPVYINIFILLLLGIRLYYAFPAYLSVVIGVYGFDYSSRQSNALPDLLWATASRFSLFMFDYILFSLLGSWPWEFVFGNKYNRFTGPVAWRRAVQFEAHEVVVRRSKGLHRKLQSPWSLDDEARVRSTVTPAMDRNGALKKSGYLLIDKEWDLDFRGMVTAHQLIQSKDIHIADFAQPTAYAFYKGRWIAWRFPTTAAATRMFPKPALNGALLSSETPQMTRFHEKLKSLGCEDLFYRWIEIIQFESSGPDGLNDKGKERALQELGTLLMAKGVEMTAFLEDMGGAENLPGMEDDG